MVCLEGKEVKRNIAIHCKRNTNWSKKGANFVKEEILQRMRWINRYNQRVNQYHQGRTFKNDGSWLSEHKEREQQGNEVPDGEDAKTFSRIGKSLDQEA